MCRYPYIKIVKTMIRNFVTFDSDSSQEEIILDDEVIPPGKDIINSIHKELIKRGLSCSNVETHDSYGWYFEVKIADAIIWCMLQMSDNWLLISQQQLPFFKKIMGNNFDAEHHQICVEINNVLQSKSTYRNILWFTEKDFKNQTNGISEP
jgi:hypothetical protein